MIRGASLVNALSFPCFWHVGGSPWILSGVGKRFHGSASHTCLGAGPSETRFLRHVCGRTQFFSALWRVPSWHFHTSTVMIPPTNPMASKIPTVTLTRVPVTKSSLSTVLCVSHGVMNGHIRGHGPSAFFLGMDGAFWSWRTLYVNACARCTCGHQSRPVTGFTGIIASVDFKILRIHIHIATYYSFEYFAST